MKSDNVLRVATRYRIPLIRWSLTLVGALLFMMLRSSPEEKVVMELCSMVSVFTGLLVVLATLFVALRTFFSRCNDSTTAALRLIDFSVLTVFFCQATAFMIGQYGDFLYHMAMNDTERFAVTIGAGFTSLLVVLFARAHLRINYHSCSELSAANPAESNSSQPNG